MKKWLASVGTAILAVFLLSACGSEQTNGDVAEGNGTSSETINVTTTTGQVADIVKHVGGDKVEVTSLMGPGVDPHLYQASQGDIQKLNEANMIFYNGLHLEGKMGEIFEKMSEDKATVAVGDSIPEDLLLAADDSTAHDPHVWFDIKAWIHAVDAVEEELTKQSPDNEELFKENAANYKKELEDLDAYAKEQIKTIPEESRVLVTAHDAFAYFGHAYGLEVMGLQGLSTDSEYGLKDVQALVDTLVGPNGAGKSTLIKGILGLIPAASGEVNIFGEQYKKQRKRVGYVPQRGSVDWDFPTNALDVVLMGRYGHVGWFKRPGKKDSEFARECLKKVGMLEFENRQISQLSGGQQQRVFLARALAQDADVYFMDEPFVGVDAATEKAIIALLNELKAKGKTVLVVHHDLQTVEEYFDWVLLLNMRKVAFGPTKDTFSIDNLQKTYGGKLTFLQDQSVVVKGK